MITRRSLTTALLTSGAMIAALPGAVSARPMVLNRPSAGRSYAQFLDGVRADGARLGIDGAVLSEALSLQAPNAKVLQLDRHQPEFTLTWAQYRDRVIGAKRKSDAAAAYQANLPMLTELWRRSGVDPRAVVGIWGLESNFGTRIGSFGVIDALATLAFDGRRASFFRAELMNALRILGRGGIAPRAMLGSYAGAMGQPQFMPSSYLRYAVAYQGGGQADIWTSSADSFASIANYLGKCGWVAGEPWGQSVSLTRPIDATRTGRQIVRSLGEWETLGVRRADGSRFSSQTVSGALLLPDGAAGDAFMVYANFNVIRRYNPSDFYALAVGLIGNAAA
jgi:membrane-bound lytic murein transglycosylase B